MPTVKNDKTGKITKYGFACGYVQKYEATGQINECVQMYKEHGVYHVKFWSVEGERHGRPIIWNSYDTYAPARKFIDAIRAAMFPPAYYQVNAAAAGKVCNLRFKGNALIAHELYTEKEVSRAKLTPEFIAANLKLIYIPSGRPYWFFGTLRKANNTN